MDLKQHNLIPEDAQAIVELYQLREYCILHLAWTRLQQKHGSNEEKKLFFTTVGNLIISLLLRLLVILNFQSQCQKAVKQAYPQNEKFTYLFHEWRLEFDTLVRLNR